MSLEEKLRAYAAKGELVSLSLLFNGYQFSAAYTAASTLGGHSFGESADPVEAIEKALKASPAKPARLSKRLELTDKERDEAERYEYDKEAERAGALSSEWTTP